MLRKNKPLTLEEKIGEMIAGIESDVVYLNNRAARAVNIFRNSAESLYDINTQLKEKNDQLRNLYDYTAGQMSNIECEINSNEAIAKRILEIIGE